MHTKYITLTIIITLSVSVNAQYFYKGIIKDKRNGEALIGTTIIVDNAQILTSNNYGYFAINHPKPSISVHFQYVGYKSLTQELIASDDLNIIEMEPDTVLIQEVNISSSHSLKTSGFTQLTSKHFDSLPVLLGEKDLLKSIQVLSGVIQNAEGTTNFSFRGSNAGENLFLIDGIPAYNINHLYGFASIFNTDAINVANFYKNGIPARYGGRNSSVTDIIVKEGNLKKYTGSYSIGLLSSRIMLEGPIKKDTASFLIAARRSFYDLFVAPITYLNDKTIMGYYFYDLTAKTNYKVNANNNVYLSLYAGKDNTYLHENSEDYKSRYNNGWANYTISTRWNNIALPYFFSNVTLAYTRFQYDNSLWEQGIKDSVVHKTTFQSGIYDYILKWDGRYYRLNHHKINMGIEWYHHSFIPGTEKKYFSQSNTKVIDRTQGLDLSGNEWNIYLDDEIEWGKWQFEAGIRYTIFNVESANYQRWQPRILLAFLPNPKININASFQIMNQFMHLTTNSSIGMPTDLWLPISNIFPPLETKQYTIGFKLNTRAFTTSFDVFYRDLRNLVDIKDGYTFYNEHLVWNDILTQGQGYSYGAEIMIENTTGAIHTILSYTYCRSFRKFNDINSGNWFNFQYDRPHSAHLLINYPFQQNKTLNASWTFTSGALTSIPVQNYFLFKRPVMDLKEKNNYRLPPFHHLDISYQTSKTKKRGIRTWQFGIYNVYAHTNPFIVRYKTTDAEGRLLPAPKLEGIGIFTFVPFIAYEFKFK